MFLLYALCAAVGGVLVVVSLLSGGRSLHGAALDELRGAERAADAEIVPVALSAGALRALIFGLCFFGATGLTMHYLGRSTETSLLISVLLGIPAGLVAAGVIHWLGPPASAEK